MLQSVLVIPPLPILSPAAQSLSVPANNSAGSDGNKQGVFSHELGAGESIQWRVHLHGFPSHGQGLHHADLEPGGVFGSAAAAG